MNLVLKSSIYAKFPTQSDFAEAIGVSEGFVSKIIRGRRTLPKNERQRWATVLGKRPEDIF